MWIIEIFENSLKVTEAMELTTTSVFTQCPSVRQDSLFIVKYLGGQLPPGVVWLPEIFITAGVLPGNSIHYSDPRVS